MAHAKMVKKASYVVLLMFVVAISGAHFFVNEIPASHTQTNVAEINPPMDSTTPPAV